MAHNPILSSRTSVASFVAAAFALTAGAAFAGTTTSHDSADTAAASSPAARHVTLTRQRSEQTIRYSHARDLRVCNLSGQNPSTNAAASVNAAERKSPANRWPLGAVAVSGTPVPVTLRYAGRNVQVQPGNCYDFRARDVHLSPARTLLHSTALLVSVAPFSGKGFVNGRMESASPQSTRPTRAASQESVKQLSAQLKKDDKEMRQANSALVNARGKLAQTTHDLKDAKSKELHVASAERQTAQSERKQQQHVRNANPAQSGSNAKRSSSGNSGAGTPE